MNFIAAHLVEILYAWSGLAIVVFISLLFIAAPYGRYSREGWGPMIPARMAWFIMESVSLVVMLLTLVYARHRDMIAVILTGLWIGHYVYRALIFPFLLRPGSHPMPLLVVLMSVVFNTMNAGANGIYLFFAGGKTGPQALPGPRFWLGLVLFIAGFVTHVTADHRLRNLRKPGDTAYKVPRGGLFEYISCPNYFGEIVEWTGWAIAAWNLAGFSFVLWTVANLLPRALTHHKWYRRTFHDYPESRKAVIPFIL